MLPTARQLSSIEKVGGTWRSLVAHLHGVQGVPSSNLGVPTNQNNCLVPLEQRLQTPVYTAMYTWTEPVSNLL
jgi:hypothetical protein